MLARSLGRLQVLDFPLRGFDLGLHQFRVMKITALCQIKWR